MSATVESSSHSSKLKDLVVTAAVASVVSALVAPWIRRWMDGSVAVGPMAPQLPGETPSPSPTDDYEQRLERLLVVPDTVSGDITTAFRSPTKRKDTHVEIEDGQ